MLLKGTLAAQSIELFTIFLEVNRNDSAAYLLVTGKVE